MNMINRLIAAIKTATSFTHGRNGTLVRLMGIWFALNPWGNCFSPALILKTYKITRNGRTAKRTEDGKSLVRDANGKFIFIGGENAYEVQAACLTIRTGNHSETTFYWYGRLSFGWNSDHIAERFGKHFSPDCDSPWEVDRHEYSGILGRHIAL